jgi:hypothetical protein
LSAGEAQIGPFERESVATSPVLYFGVLGTRGSCRAVAFWDFRVWEEVPPQIPKHALVRNSIREGETRSRG